MMRACLVSRPARGDAAADRLRGAGLAVLRAIERVTAFGLGLGLVMGTSEVCATPSAAPPQPRPAKPPGRAGPWSGPEPPPVATATLHFRPKSSRFCAT